MDTFNIQIMLSSGTINDYEIRNDRKRKDVYEIFQKGSPVATFQATPDGSWKVTDNAADIDQDLIERIGKQLTGYHI